MGRIIERKVLGIRCENTKCRAKFLMPPVAESTDWTDMVQNLADAVVAGWGIQLKSRLRSYCPAHSSGARACSCWTHRSYSHTCPAHDDEAASLVWDEKHTPDRALRLLRITENSTLGGTE